MNKHGFEQFVTTLPPYLQGTNVKRVVELEKAARVAATQNELLLVSIEELEKQRDGETQW